MNKAVLVFTLLYVITAEVGQSCFSIPNNICIKHNEKVQVFQKPKEQKGLLGYWNFDSDAVQDSSHFQNAGVGDFSFGPGWQSHGSLHLNGTQSVKISKLNKQIGLENKELTIQFWIMLLHHEKGSYGQIIHKGNWLSEYAKLPNLTPTILLAPFQSKLILKVSTNEQWDLSLMQIGQLTVKKWTQVTAIITPSFVSLYIDGTKNNQANIVGTIQVNDNDFYIGADQFHQSPDMLIDEFKIFNYKQDEAQIRSIIPPLQSIYTQNIRISCEQCSYDDAVIYCDQMIPAEFQLCSEKQMQYQGYNYARRLGWDVQEEMWVREDNPGICQGDTCSQKIIKNALCCEIL